jgi:signal transduction histidine kinase
MIVSSLPADEITFETLTLLSLISRQVGLIMENIKAYTSLADEHQALLDAQERIILSEKMASIGRLASRASHEILNPLNIIMGNAQLLLAKANLDATKKKYVERILSQAERIEGIVRALIKVSDLSSTHKKPLDLTKLVEKSIKLFRTDFSKADIRVYFNSDSREITVLGHELGLLEVMVSIFRNSVEAMPNGGKIEISLSSNPGLGTATLTVSDNGVGIQEDDLDKLFEPFFTTKNTKNNLGIGLYLAYTIIKEHGGNIEITGEEGKGAATTITLPLYNETRTEPA